MLFEHIISIIAPHNCLSCGIEGALLCSGCVEQLPYPPCICYRCQKSLSLDRICDTCQGQTPLSGLYIRTTYSGLAKSLLWRLKFDRAAAAAHPVAKACGPLVAFRDDTVLTCVPTASVRIRQRGYDHAERITRRVAKHTKLPYYTLLRRTTSTRQVGADGQMRRSQLRDAFRATKPGAVSGKHVILVDDVITTGSSLEAAACVLVNAGARSVNAVVFATAEVKPHNDLVSSVKAGIITSVR